MTIYDLQQGEGSECVLGDVPIIDSVSANASSLSLIYRCVRGVEGKDWLNHATKSAMGEMISDVDMVVREAKEAIKSARKQIPFHYRYFINPFNSWLQKLK